ncbi:TetR family transcriptional regulator C-terminal domain-containing protein [Nitrospira sp. Kam-Ns4a]
MSRARRSSSSKDLCKRARSAAARLRLSGLHDSDVATSEPFCGCLLGSFAQELSDSYPKIRSQCAAHFAQWTATFKRDLDAAKAKYVPRAAFDTQSLAEHFIAVFEGALILAKAKQDRQPVEVHLRHFRRYVQSLFEGARARRPRRHSRLLRDEPEGGSDGITGQAHSHRLSGYHPDVDGSGGEESLQPGHLGRRRGAGR